jgi:hypothetical protein
MKSIIKYNLIVLLSIVSLNYGSYNKYINKAIKTLVSPFEAIAEEIDPTDKYGIQKQYKKIYETALKVGAAYADHKQGFEPGKGYASQLARIYSETEDKGEDHSIDKYAKVIGKAGAEYVDKKTGQGLGSQFYNEYYGSQASENSAANNLEV